MYATSGSSIFKSTNSGTTYTSVTTGLPGKTITSVYVHPDSPNVVLLTCSGFGTGHIYKSTDGAASWQNISGNLPDSPANDVLILPYSNTALYLLATDVGIFVTENWGSSWIELAAGLPNTVAIHLDYNKTTREIFLGTHGRGIFKTNLLFALNYSVLIEGFYNSSTNTMVPDTVMIYLAKASSPFTKIDSAKVLMNSSGTSTAYFAKAVRDSAYYLVIKHRNSIETWSAAAQTFNSFDLVYDFTSAQNKAYGNNLTQKGSKWCIYSGDVNQDGLIDLSDILIVDSDNLNFVTGYVVTDTNGDNLVDITDLQLVSSNNLLFISKITPY